MILLDVKHKYYLEKYIIIIKKCYILKKNIYVCVINLKKIQKCY